MILHMSIGFEIGTAPSPLSSLMAILWRTGHIYRLPKSIVLGIVRSAGAIVGSANFPSGCIRASRCRMG